MILVKDSSNNTLHFSTYFRPLNSCDIWWHCHVYLSIECHVLFQWNPTIVPQYFPTPLIRAGCDVIYGQLFSLIILKFQEKINFSKSNVQMCFKSTIFCFLENFSPNISHHSLSRSCSLYFKLRRIVEQVMKYNARRLIGSRIIESAANCNQI